MCSMIALLLLSIRRILWQRITLIYGWCVNTGVEDSWTKQLVVGPLLGIDRPLQFFNNVVLFLAGDDDAIAWYNISSNEIRNLRLPESFISIRAMVYVESLVSLTGVSQKIKNKKLVSLTGGNVFWSYGIWFMFYFSISYVWFRDNIIWISMMYLLNFNSIFLLNLCHLLMDL